jgi:hypothetical protein
MHRPEMTDRNRLESVFNRRVFPELPIEFTLAWDLLNVGQEIVVGFTAGGGVEPRDPAHRRAALVPFGRLYDDYLGVLHLAGQGLGLQASVVLRSMLNSYYWLAYVLEDDEERESRGREYLASGWNSIMREFRKAEDEGVEIDPQFRAQVERQTAAAPDIYPQKPERLARHAGLDWHYQQAYVPLSAIEHGEAKNFLLSVAEDGALHVGPRQDRWLLQIVRNAFSAFHSAAQVFLALFELDHDTKVDELWDRAVAAGWGPPADT